MQRIWNSAPFYRVAFHGRGAEGAGAQREHHNVGLRVKVNFLTAQFITGLAPVLESNSTSPGIALVYRGVKCVNGWVALAGTSM